MDEIKKDLAEIKKDLAEIKKDSAETQKDIVEIKVDLRHHIRRTDLLEKEVHPVAKFINFVTWAAFSTGLIAAVLKIKQLIGK